MPWICRLSPSYPYELETSGIRGAERPEAVVSEVWRTKALAETVRLRDGQGGRALRARDIGRPSPRGSASRLAVAATGDTGLVRGSSSSSSSSSSHYWWWSWGDLGVAQVPRLWSVAAGNWHGRRATSSGKALPEIMARGFGLCIGALALPMETNQKSTAKLLFFYNNELQS